MTKTAGTIAPRANGVQLEEEILRGPVENRRATALKLGRAGGAESLEFLDALCEDPDDEVHYIARMALDQVLSRMPRAGGLGDVDPQQLCRGLESAEPRERIRSARLLSWYRHPMLLSRLQGSLESESDPLTLGYLVRAAMTYAEPAMAPVLARFLGHASREVRLRAVEGAWGSPDQTLVQLALKSLKDPDARVQGHALVLFILQDGRDAHERARTLVKADRQWIRLALVYAMGRLRRGWALQELSRIARDTSQPGAVRTLAREYLPGSLSTSASRSAPGAPDPTIRTDLTQNIVALPDEASWLEALHDEDSLIRLHAVQNSVRFERETAIPLIRGMLDSESDPMVIATLVIALGRLEGSAAADRIRPFFGHADARVRANALESLARVQATVPVEEIQGLLEDESTRVRAHAARLLFQVSADVATARFRTLLLGEDPTTRESAFFSLSQLRDDRIISLFSEALRDRRRPVYLRAREVVEAMASEWSAAAALLAEFRSGRLAGEVAGDEPVSVLLSMLDSSVQSERVVAIQRLMTAEDPRVDLMLEVNLAARDPSVRTEAARALAWRHEHRALPSILERLGRAYLDRTAAGHALVPHSLRHELSRIAREPAPEDGDPSDPLDRRVGEVLYRAYERHHQLADDLTALCHEVRTLREQIESYQSGVRKPGSQESVAPLDSTATRRPAQPSSRPTGRIRELSVPAEVGPDGSEEQPRAGSMRWALHLVSLYIAFEAGRFWQASVATPDARTNRPVGGLPAAGPSSSDPTPADVELLDRMSLVRDPARFREEFGDRKIVTFVARLDAILDGPVRSLKLRSGSTDLRLDLAPSQGLPPANLERKYTTFRGRVKGREAKVILVTDGQLVSRAAP